MRNHIDIQLLKLILFNNEICILFAKEKKFSHASANAIMNFSTVLNLIA